MGFLNNLLNPVKHVRNSWDSTKHLLHGDIKSAVATSPLVNQGNHSVSATGSAPKTDPSLYGVGDPNDPSLYGGDATDPQYGSFTQPFDVEQFYNYADPGYSFELQQGTQALQNAASAGSGAFSGAALKDLLNYSQGFARTGYNDAFNRYQTQQGNIFSRLFDLTRLGQSAAAGVGTSGTNAAANAGQFLSNSGSAYGAGIVGAGNSLSQGATNYWLMKQYGGGQPNTVGGGV